jgi:hypothetical protein
MARPFHSRPKLFGADMLVQLNWAEIKARICRGAVPGPGVCFGSGGFGLKETFQLTRFMAAVALSWPGEVSCVEMFHGRAAIR